MSSPDSSYIARGDLWPAHLRLEGIRSLLLTVLEWHARSLRADPVDTLHNGHHIDEWLAPAYRERIPELFALYTRDDLSRALRATCRVSTSRPRTPFRSHRTHRPGSTSRHRAVRAAPNGAPQRVIYRGGLSSETLPGMGLVVIDRVFVVIIRGFMIFRMVRYFFSLSTGDLLPTAGLLDFSPTPAVPATEALPQRVAGPPKARALRSAQDERRRESHRPEPE
ncbi:aminoglycoside 6-adenylyltransferase [Rhodococcus sp. (in: high G+C Gram-positive bacteria)]|uniref:aminoglycoside 6-adenylyltransferase n=1 Tax=Rhodococcus sp. TaxID=1831 RepID=UPI00388F59F7